MADVFTDAFTGSAGSIVGRSPDVGAGGGTWTSASSNVSLNGTGAIYPTGASGPSHGSTFCDFDCGDLQGGAFFEVDFDFQTSDGSGYNQINYFFQCYDALDFDGDAVNIALQQYPVGLGDGIYIQNVYANAELGSWTTTRVADVDSGLHTLRVELRAAENKLSVYFDGSFVGDAPWTTYVPGTAYANASNGFNWTDPRTPNTARGLVSRVNVYTGPLTVSSQFWERYVKTKETI